MKNFINYYYNLFPNKIFKSDNEYYFFIHNIKFVLKEYNRDINLIDELVKVSNELYNLKVPINTFVINKDKKFISINNNINYVLFKINYYSQDVMNVNDIIRFNNYLSIDNISNLLYVNTLALMKDRVDMFEKQMIEYNNEYNIIVNSFNYYVGLAENAICYASDSIRSNALDNSINYYISHSRLKNSLKSSSLYDPLTLVFDYKSRDLSHYIKINFFNGINVLDELENIIKSGIFNSLELKMLYSKLLYPDYYFDLVEDIILNEKKEKHLSKYINLTEKYENYLFDIYIIINKYVNIPQIDWLINKNK